MPRVGKTDRESQGQRGARQRNAMRAEKGGERTRRPKRKEEGYSSRLVQRWKSLSPVVKVAIVVGVVGIIYCVSQSRTGETSKKVAGGPSGPRFKPGQPANLPVPITTHRPAQSNAQFFSRVQNVDQKHKVRIPVAFHSEDPRCDTPSHLAIKAEDRCNIARFSLKRNSPPPMTNLKGVTFMSTNHDDPEVHTVLIEALKRAANGELIMYVEGDDVEPYQKLYQRAFRTEKRIPESNICAFEQSPDGSNAKQYDLLGHAFKLAHDNEADSLQLEYKLEFLNYLRQSGLINRVWDNLPSVWDTLPKADFKDCRDLYEKINFLDKSVGVLSLGQNPIMTHPQWEPLLKACLVVSSEIAREKKWPFLSVGKLVVDPNEENYEQFISDVTVTTRNHFAAQRIATHIKGKKQGSHSKRSKRSKQPKRLPSLVVVGARHVPDLKAKLSMQLLK